MVKAAENGIGGASGTTDVWDGWGVPALGWQRRLRVVMEGLCLKKYFCN